MADSDIETGKLGSRGTFVIPAGLRRRFGLTEGTLLIAEARPDGILLRPAVAIPTETYTLERRAAFVLENAVDADDYDAARAAVRAMGLDPDAIAHEPPAGSPGRAKRERGPTRDRGRGRRA